MQTDKASSSHVSKNAFGRRTLEGSIGAILILLICVHPCLSVVPSSEREVTQERIDAAVERGVRILLDMQTGVAGAEWPYECVHKVDGEIPLGYRVGSTAIAAMALLHAPEARDRETYQQRREAIERSARFIINSIRDPLMAPQLSASYNVRGWGYMYGLQFLLRAVDADALSEELAVSGQRAVETFIRHIVETEIPETGGWNYDQRMFNDRPIPPSPFMTAATLQVLFEAAAHGYRVPTEVIERGLDSIQRAKRASGAYVYSGVARGRSREAVPGSVGRMVIAESTLHLAGRSSLAEVRGAIDAFLVHWEWLEKRRGERGTHAPPYGVAPYYFHFAHYYAAQAIELLPQTEREEYRRRLNERLLSVRREDGSWNDRVFERSAAYGTAVSIMAMTMPDLPQIPRWAARPTR